MRNTDCEHKEADHEHGTHACYVLDKCRCHPCKTANTAYEKHRRAWTGEFPRTTPPLVDARPVREHVNRLREQGMGSKLIARKAGVPPSAVGAIIWGRKDRKASRIRRETAEALLNVELELADGQKVDGTEASLIVEELVRRGWSLAAVGRRVHGPQAVALQLRGDLVFVSTLKTLRLLLTEPVPDKPHNPTGTFYNDGIPFVEWLDVPETTPGVPPSEPVFPDWLRELDRERLFQTYAQSRVV